MDNSLKSQVISNLKQRKLMTYNLIDTAAASALYPLIPLLTTWKIHWLDQQASLSDSISSLSDSFSRQNWQIFSFYLNDKTQTSHLKGDGQKTEKALLEQASFASSKQPVSPP